MGQSGRPGNRHYDDMIRRWIEGTVVPLPLSRDGAERIARNRLTFLP
jgi:acyl-homoserine lactone acylase PvdQ